MLLIKTDMQKGRRMHKEELYDYISSVRRLQDTYKDQIEIRLGMEIEYFEDQLDELMQYKEDMDFLILGQHGSSLYGPEFYDDHSDEDVLLYASLIEKACERGLPDIIAHPDLFMFGKEIGQLPVRKRHIQFVLVRRSTVFFWR